jgi:hypothetical protein
MGKISPPPPPGFDPGTLQPVASRYTDCTTPLPYTEGNAVRVDAVNVLDGGEWPGFDLRPLTHGKRCCLNGRLVGPQSQSRLFGAEINILPLPGSEARFFDYPTLAVTFPAPTFARSSCGQNLWRSRSIISYGSWPRTDSRNVAIFFAASARHKAM